LLLRQGKEGAQVVADTGIKAGKKISGKAKEVYDAVKIILSSVDDIEIFNKKAIYLYIREITGLNTKQVVNNLNKMRVRYRVFKKKWNRGEI